MASNIVHTTIDAAYPVAGVDNDTQGFRDNFSIIKNNFAAAYTEITDLQTNGARLDSENTFNGTSLVAANMQATTEQHYYPGVYTAGSNINFQTAQSTTIRINVAQANTDGTTTMTFTLSDFPATSYPIENYTMKHTVYLKGLVAEDVDPVAIVFDAEGGITVKKSPGYPTSLTVDGVDDPHVIEFTLLNINNARTVYAEYKGLFSA